MKSAVVVFPGINRERDMARTLRLVSGAEPIEQRHGIPVVTSTQSAFWKAMRLAGDSGAVKGRGRMLAQSQAVPA